MGERPRVPTSAWSPSGGGDLRRGWPASVARDLSCPVSRRLPPCAAPCLAPSPERLSPSSACVTPVLSFTRIPPKNMPTERCATSRASYCGIELDPRLNSVSGIHFRKAAPQVRARRKKGEEALSATQHAACSSVPCFEQTSRPPPYSRIAGPCPHLLRAVAPILRGMPRAHSTTAY